MKTMKKCLSCGGLAPLSHDTCPNCAVTPRGSLNSTVKKVLATAGFVTLVATATSCVAIYGAPCALKQVDGGNNGCPGDCSTLQEDGGVPDPNDGCVTPGVQ